MEMDEDSLTRELGTGVYYEEVYSCLPDNLGTVLDIGVGAGLHISSLCSRAKRVVTVDVEPHIARRAKGNSGYASNLEFGLSDLRSLPFDNDSFDTVFCLDTLCYLDRPLEGIHELERVVGSRGHIALTFASEEAGRIPGLVKLRNSYMTLEQCRDVLEGNRILYHRPVPISEVQRPKPGQVSFMHRLSEREKGFASKYLFVVEV